MYELIKVSDLCYYIQSPSRVGIIKTGENAVCLIDAGNNKDAGKRIKRILDCNGWTLDAIYNTHSHADHIGGNQYLQSQTGCRIYAPAKESHFINHPILEPSLIYGGNPPSELRHKFLLADESVCEYLTNETLPKGFKAISLKGHTPDMVGFISPDGIVFLADCLLSRETLDKYGIGFIYDIEEYLNTLESVKNIKAKLFIPSHTEPTDDIASLAQYNIDRVSETADRILTLCEEPKCFEHLLRELFDLYSLEISFEQYALVGSTVRSYLTYLKDKGKIEAVFRDNTVLWKSV